MNISPIPKKLLRHSAVLTVTYEADLWGNDSSAASAPMDNVRFEPVYKNSRTTAENGVVITAKLFFDCTNSSCALPNRGRRKLRSEILSACFRKLRRLLISAIEEVREFYSYSKPHHLEILLSG